MWVHLLGSACSDLLHLGWGGPSSCWRTQRHVQTASTSPEEGPAPGPLLQQCFLLPPLTSLVSNCLNMPFWTHGRVKKLKALFLQIRNWTHGKTFVSKRAPQGPAHLQSFYLHNPLVGNKKVGLFRTWKVVPSQTNIPSCTPATDCPQIPKVLGLTPISREDPGSALSNSSWFSHSPLPSSGMLRGRLYNFYTT